jgi:hypothetical protein
MSRFLEADGGLPRWLLSPKGAMLAMLVFLIAVPTTMTVLEAADRLFPARAVSCFDTEPARYTVQSDTMTDQTSSMFDGMRQDYPPLDVLEAAANECRVGSCSSEARDKYRAALREYLVRMFRQYSIAHKQSGKEGLAAFEAYYQGSRQIAVHNSIGERVEAGIFDVRDYREYSDLLNMLVYTKNPVSCYALERGDAQAG